MTDTTTDAITPRVDVAFPLMGERVPLDHGYPLFAALAGVLGDLHGATWLAVHPLRGIPRGDGYIGLKQHNLALQLRVEPTSLLKVLPIAGKELTVDGQRLMVGVSRVFALEPAPVLTTRMVVIKKFMEEAPFREAVARQLVELGVKADIEVGRRRVVTVAGDRVVGFGVTLTGLSDEDSLKVQYHGVGGRQRFGCGVFVPRRGKTVSE